MGQKVLADWLQGKYSIDKRGTVKAKEPLYHIIRGERKEVPENGIWFQTFSSRDNQDLVVSVIPALLHAYCLQLAEEYDDIVQLKTAERVYHRWPWQSEGTLHGYMTIRNSAGVLADGEVHLKTVQPSMIPFICTIMTKRAEDRLILKALGLYAQGFYSQEEFPTDANDVDVYSKNTISKEEIERNQRKALMGELAVMFKEKQAQDESFNPEVYTQTLLGISDVKDATLENWMLVKETLSKELKGN
jgi:hypothetical protein